MMHILDMSIDRRIQKCEDAFANHLHNLHPRQDIHARIVSATTAILLQRAELPEHSRTLANVCRYGYEKIALKRFSALHCLREEHKKKGE